MSDEGWGSTSWSPEPDYASDNCDILNDFYLPALGQAVSYDRITGFFASSALAVYWSAMPGFVDRGGVIHLLCSPRITELDAQGIERGYTARDDDTLSAALKAEFDALLESPNLRKPALALSALISEGVIEVRLARVAGASLDDRRMFHDKVGLFKDEQGQTIGFRGSLNETRFGISSDGNVESFDVWTSWSGRNDRRRVERATERFDRLWSGQSDGVEVLELPSPFRHWLDTTSEGVDWRELSEEIANQHETDLVIRTAPDGRPLRKQQIRGLDRWEDNGRRGILAHATGSGKTVTGITAIVNHDGPALVIAPSRLVARQWVEQMEAAGRRVHLCGDGETGWRTRLRTWLDYSSDRVVVALAPTASQEAFINQTAWAENLLLVGDEVHRLGAPAYQAVLKIDAAARLGLSATPERAGDPDGTEKILDYFGGVIDSYTLQDALDDGALCNYLYYPQLVRLSDSEQDSWDELSTRIGRLTAIAKTSTDSSVQDRLKTLVMQRARIAKKAEAKTPLAYELLAGRYEDGQRWLVYCDDREQMESVAEGLRDKGVPAQVYHSDMAGSKTSTLRHFEENGGVLVSIKCLDEGVDIPNASHALILASSRNPREFIQRRGRVLRLSPGKDLATIYDAILQPSPSPSDETTTGSLFQGELARAGNFAGSALNTDSRDVLEQLVIEAGRDLGDLYQLLGAAGEEVDEE